MDTLWSREFGIALTVFVAPMALAAGLVYRRIQRLALRRKYARRALKVDYLRRLLEEQDLQVVIAVGTVSLAGPTHRDESGRSSDHPKVPEPGAINTSGDYDGVAGVRSWALNSSKTSWHQAERPLQSQWDVI